MANHTTRRSGKKKQNVFAINTIIGPGSFIQGDIDAFGFTRVDGSVKGNLHSEGRVVVGAGARMQSSITGTSITIGGIVDGNIMASERLVVLSSALIIGDIITRRIEVNDGCLIQGRVKVCQTTESWESAKSEYQDKQHTDLNYG
ncbi:MAG: polymer-forming cytoskeletal protein [Treponema sp.]|jgi:cytoskeletal protein CcmA (bactofilin family)|nr:polymer-forming cytoskeletal protein [Treponema sp.]